jgi:hypothetical protein
MFKCYGLTVATEANAKLILIFWSSCGFVANAPKAITGALEMAHKVNCVWAVFFTMKSVVVGRHISSIDHN